jgi:hypothetical protein
MQAETYIPRRLDDQWKIGFWDVDVAIPVVICFFVLRGLHGRGHLSLAVVFSRQGRQTPGVRRPLDLLVPAAESAHVHARDATVAPAPDDWLRIVRWTWQS